MLTALLFTKIITYTFVTDEDYFQRNIDPSTYNSNLQYLVCGYGFQAQ